MAFSVSYFEVSAQLIPVLFLALVVEERVQPGEPETAGDRVARSWALALMVIGETLALAVVAGGLSPSRANGSTVSCAMLLAAMLIVAPAIEREFQPGRSKRERWAHLLAGLAALGCVLVTILAILAH
jgi:hypothetical protein